MDRQRAKELLPIIQAFSEGKKVSYRPLGITPVEWMGTDSPNFNDEGIRWRVTPEPLVLYVNDYGLDSMSKQSAYRDKDMCKTNAGSEAVRVAIKMVESES